MRQHWLPALRKVLGLSQAAMARELGISRGRVWQLENEGGSMEGERVYRVWERHGARLRAMGFSLQDLLNPPRRGEAGKPAAAPAR